MRVEEQKAGSSGITFGAKAPMFTSSKNKNKDKEPVVLQMGQDVHEKQNYDFSKMNMAQVAQKRDLIEGEVPGNIQKHRQNKI